MVCILSFADNIPALADPLSGRGCLRVNQTPGELASRKRSNSLVVQRKSAVSRRERKRAGWLIGWSARYLLDLEGNARLMAPINRDVDRVLPGLGKLQMLDVDNEVAR